MPDVQMANMQMPGMSGMKCCCPAGGAQTACRCGVQPAPKLTAALLLWSPLAVLPASLRFSPPHLAAYAYPAAAFALAAPRRTPLPRPPRSL